MLCTLNTSKVHFKSNVSIVVYDGGDMEKDTTEVDDNNTNESSRKGNSKFAKKKKNSLPLYEYKDLFRIVR